MLCLLKDQSQYLISNSFILCILFSTFSTLKSKPYNFIMVSWQYVSITFPITILLLSSQKFANARIWVRPNSIPKRQLRCEDCFTIYNDFFARQCWTVTYPSCVGLDIWSVKLPGLNICSGPVKGGPITDMG